MQLQHKWNDFLIRIIKEMYEFTYYKISSSINIDLTNEKINLFELYKNDFLSCNFFKYIINNRRLFNFESEYIITIINRIKPLKDYLIKCKKYNKKRNLRYNDVVIYVWGINEFLRLKKYLYNNGIQCDCEYNLKEKRKIQFFQFRHLNNRLYLTLCNEYYVKDNNLKPHITSEFIEDYEKFKKVTQFKLLSFNDKIKFLLNKIF